MEYTRLGDRDQIKEYLNPHPELFVYSLGDLDDDLWPHTKWFGAVEGGSIKAICMAFTKYDPPLAQVISEPDNHAINGLISAISGELPDRTRVHFGDVTDTAFAESYERVNRAVGRWRYRTAAGLLMSMYLGSKSSNTVIWSLLSACTNPPTENRRDHIFSPNRCSISDSISE